MPYVARYVMLQYYISEFIFSFLIANLYNFSLRCTGLFPFSLKFSLFSFRCYLLSAFVLFLTFLRASVQQGTDQTFAVVFGEFRCLKISLHVDCVVASKFSINTTMSF